MATTLVEAVQDLYDSISAATFGGADRPPIHMGEAPQRTPTSTPLVPPYVVLYDEGFRPEFNSSAGGIENGDIRFEVFAVPMSGSGVTVDSITAALKWGGSGPASKAGMDWGAFTLTGYNYKVSLRRTLERRSYSGLDHNGDRVHKCEIRYAVILGLNAS